VTSPSTVVHLKLNDQAQRTVLCKDPFRVGGRTREAADRRRCSYRVRTPNCAGRRTDSSGSICCTTAGGNAECARRNRHLRELALFGCFLKVGRVTLQSRRDA